MKKIIIITLVIVLALTSFAGCAEPQKTIGIIKFGNHDSLNNTLEGIKLGLVEGGIDLDEYKLEVLDSNSDASVSASQAQSLKNKNVEIIGAIATPSAMATAQAVGGKIPVVFAAVSDPTSLIAMDNVTGSSDVLDFEGQLDLIQAIQPDVKTIGVIYSINEPNSISQIKVLEDVAKKRGIKIISKSINAVNEIVTTTNTLVSEGIDALTGLTDNTVVQVMSEILKILTPLGIPVYGSEVVQVEGYDITIDGVDSKIGTLASASLDYVALGKETGLLMARILKGESIVKGEYISVEDSFFCYNSDMAELLGLTVPAMVSGKEVTDVA